jgi:hypothetical protein
MARETAQRQRAQVAKSAGPGRPGVSQQQMALKSFRASVAEPPAAFRPAGGWTSAQLALWDTYQNSPSGQVRERAAAEWRRQLKGWA